MKEDMTSVSAIVTTFERNADIVERAIKSIIAQTFPVKEILVVDDNKDDSSYCGEIQTLCSKYAQVTYIRQNGNKGACAARNLGLRHATGEFIGFLDDDDQWLPDKIEKQLKMFAENDETLGLVFCSGIQVDEKTGEETDYYNLYMKKEVSFEDELGCDYVGSTSNPLLRKSCFDVVGGFWEDQPARQDYEMWLRIAKKYAIKGIEGKHFIYNLHSGDQITKDKRKSYMGFRNIYFRYKKEYEQYLEARLNILNWLIWNREGITIEVLRFLCERLWVRIKLKIK